jgi:hypothetical protein
MKGSSFLSKLSKEEKMKKLEAITVIFKKLFGFNNLNLIGKKKSIRK